MSIPIEIPGTTRTVSSATPLISAASSISEASSVGSISQFKNQSRRSKSVSISNVQSNYKKVAFYHDLGISFKERGKTEMEYNPEKKRISDLGKFKTHKRGFSDNPSHIHITPGNLKSSVKFNANTFPEPKTFGTIVFVSTFNHLFAPSEALAKLYKIIGDPVQVANHNRNVVSELGRKDLEQIWNMVLLIIEKSDVAVAATQEILKHLELTKDFQTLCMVLCVLAQESNNSVEGGGKVKIDYWTGSESIGFENSKFKEKIEFVGDSGKCRKSRLGMSLYKPFSHSGSRDQIGTYRLRYTSSFAAPSVKPIDFGGWKQHVAAYSNYLYYCGLFEERCLLLKLIRVEEITQNTLNLGSTRALCGYCRLPVRGLGTYCPDCFHGGHARCLKDSGNEMGCILGCGCDCNRVIM
jgi:Zinc-ribbon, C4HC2 type